MPQFTAISRDSHAGKKWQRFKSYGFASKVVLAPVVGVEVARAALALPLAFLQEAERFVLVAVLSLKPGRNMLVAPDGRWLGGYVPAYLRAYPFRLLPQQGTDQIVLCIDTDSGLVVEGDAAGEDFVGPDGNISPALKKVLDFLNELERSRRATDVAVAALAESRCYSALADKAQGRAGRAGHHWSVSRRRSCAQCTGRRCVPEIA